MNVVQMASFYGLFGKGGKAKVFPWRFVLTAPTGVSGNRLANFYNDWVVDFLNKEQQRGKIVAPFREYPE